MDIRVVALVVMVVMGACAFVENFACDLLGSHALFWDSAEGVFGLSKGMWCDATPVT